MTATAPVSVGEYVTRASSRTACRVCDNTQLMSYLNLGKQPYANALQPPDAPLLGGMPLRVLACQRCHLSQLSYVAPREALYGSYAYRSGVSTTWREHCAKLAREYGGANKFALDIASNDGTMVRAMAATGATAVGVEPSESFADCAYGRISGWWTAELVIAQELTGYVDVITAQNVLGHVHDVHSFMAGIERALKRDGVAIIEVPYMLDMLDALSFDTVYHEHLSYWSVTALQHLCRSHALTLADVQPLAMHGGSIRAIIRRDNEASPRVARYIERERRELKKSSYLRFSERVSARMGELNNTLRSMVPYIGFGAAAKTTVMLGCVDVRAYPDVVYDDNEHKHGFAIPGTRVPIAAPPTNWRAEMRPACIFTWNYADDIIAKLRAAGYRGDIFVPTAKPRWDTP